MLRLHHEVIVPRALGRQSRYSTSEIVHIVLPFVLEELFEKST